MPMTRRTMISTMMANRTTEVASAPERASAVTVALST